MRVMRRTVLGLLASAVVAACGTLPQGGPVAGDFRLYVATSTPSGYQVAIVDSRSHRAIGGLPVGTPSPDWTRYYTAGGGSLTVFDPHTGVALRTMLLPRAYLLPTATLSGVPGGLSPNGRWLALETSPSDTESHLLVVDTLFKGQPVAVDLAGSYTFDAISNDGQRLYLIQHSDGFHYYVRFYNLSSHALDPQVVFDKSDGANAMTGTRLSGIPSLDGQWLFSVYARPDKGSFVHALNLDAAIAFCLDLPGAGYSTDPTAFMWSLAMSGDGSRLYAANGPMGLVASLSTGANNSMPSILRTTQVGSASQTAAFGVQNVQAKELGGGGAAVSPDGKTLVMSGATGISWISTTSLQASASGLSSRHIWSLALSPSGDFIFALDEAGNIAQLTIKGAVLSSFDPKLGQPLAIMRVEPAP